jgi:hypothetical protein
MADDEAEKPTVRPTTREEMARLPATYVDFWTINTWHDYMRITFAEWLQRQPHYRVAIAMSLEDAENLGNHLLESVAKRRARDAEEAKKG